MSYEYSMIITKQKLILDTQKGKKREPNFNIKESHKRQKKTAWGEEMIREQKQPWNIYENGNKNIHIDNYFNCQWPKCTIEKTEGDWMVTKNTTHPFSTYKRLTSDWNSLKTESLVVLFHFQFWVRNLVGDGFWLLYCHMLPLIYTSLTHALIGKSDWLSSKKLWCNYPCSISSEKIDFLKK